MANDSKQAATLKQLVEAAYEVEAFEPNLTRVPLSKTFNVQTISQGQWKICMVLMISLTKSYVSPSTPYYIQALH